jgi:hypothetical protein
MPRTGCAPYTDAIANPRRADNDDDFMALPIDRRRGIAFQSLLETVLESDLPVHGATATSVVVTIDHQALVTGLGTADMSIAFTPAISLNAACEAAIAVSTGWFVASPHHRAPTCKALRTPYPTSPSARSGNSWYPGSCGSQRGASTATEDRR